MIILFVGPEGAGKTALMTSYNWLHYKMGGECWSFPGYEFINRGKAVSRLVMPEEIMHLLDEMQHVVLSIDEIQNFTHHHKWWDFVVEIITVAAAQRRKREFNIMATTPDFGLVPPDLKHMFHMVAYCADRHWKYKTITRGRQISVVYEDRRGVLSGEIGTRTNPSIFDPTSFFKNYNTFSLVDPRYLTHKTKVKKEEVLVDESGKVIHEAIIPIDSALVDKYIDDYQKPVLDPLMKAAWEVALKLKNNGITIVDSSILYDSLGKGRRKGLIGKALMSVGAISQKWNKTYDLSQVPTVLPSLARGKYKL